MVAAKEGVSHIGYGFTRNLILDQTKMSQVVSRIQLSIGATNRVQIEKSDAFAIHNDLLIVKVAVSWAKRLFPLQDPSRAERARRREQEIGGDGKGSRGQIDPHLKRFQLALGSMGVRKRNFTIVKGRERSPCGGAR